MVSGLSTSWLSFSLFSSIFSGHGTPPTRTETFALLITPTGPNSHSLTTRNVPLCARTKFYGSYGRPPEYVYGLDEDCLTVTFATLDSGVVSLPLPGPQFGDSVLEKRVLVWLQDAGVDATLRSGREFYEDMDVLEKNVKAHRVPLRVVEQVAVPARTSNEDIFSFVYRSRSSAIVSVHEELAAHIDKLLPPYVVPIMLPAEPAGVIPVPGEATERVNKVVSRRHFAWDGGCLSLLYSSTIYASIRISRLYSALSPLMACVSTFDISPAKTLTMRAHTLCLAIPSVKGREMPQIGSNIRSSSAARNANKNISCKDTHRMSFGAASISVHSTQFL
jgi:hypothetical protein